MFDDDLKKDKRRNFIMVAAVFVIMTAMVALDIVFKWRSAANFRAKLRDGNLAKLESPVFLSTLSYNNFTQCLVEPNTF